MQVSRFDGGLSERVHSSLILENEGTVYSNIDNTDLLLNSASNYSILPQTVNGYFYIFGDNYLNSTAERSYVEYQNKLYFTEKNKRARKHDGNRESNLGINEPAAKLIATQAEPDATEKIAIADAVLQYTYTYYNSADDVESAPAPLSDETTILADKVADVSGFVASTDIQVDKVRLYRIGDSITTMTLVEEIDHTTLDTYRDDTLTVDLPGDILDSYNNQVLADGARHLAEAYGIMFAAIGSTLHFSSIGKPDYWPGVNTIAFSNDITMILPVQNGILIGSADKIEIIIGTDSASFRKLPLTSEQGAISHASAKTVKTVPVWASKDGICTYTGSYVQVISKDKLGKRTLSIVNTAVLSEVYYVCLSDGSILAMDLRFGMTFANYNFTDRIDNILVKDGVLYGRVGDDLITLFTGDPLTLDYKSPLFIEGSHSQTKNYNNFYLRSNGTFTVKMFIDGDEVSSHDVTGDTIHDLSPPAEEQRGSGLQVQITGIGTVYEYEFKVVGRQNGR